MAARKKMISVEHTRKLFAAGWRRKSSGHWVKGTASRSYTKRAALLREKIISEPVARTKVYIGPSLDPDPLRTLCDMTHKGGRCLLPGRGKKKSKRQNTPQISAYNKSRKKSVRRVPSHKTV